MHILRSIAAHPWTSAQDIVLLGMVMLGATVVAIEYDLLRFGDELTPATRRIRLEELLILSGLLFGGVFVFVLRRQHETRRDLTIADAIATNVQRLHKEANQDPLTGLPNRRAVMAALMAATSGPEQNHRTHAFYILDLDGFKRVNDRSGHGAGDRVLNLVVERLRAAARPTDLVGRLGGDEFAVLACDVDGAAAAAIGRRFIAALECPVVTETCAHEVGVSIGIAMIPLDGIVCEEIIANADAAMYRAKAHSESALAFCGARDAPSARLASAN